MGRVQWLLVTDTGKPHVLHANQRDRLFHSPTHIAKTRRLITQSARRFFLSFKFIIINNQFDLWSWRLFVFLSAFIYLGSKNLEEEVEEEKRLVMPWTGRCFTFTSIYRKMWTSGSNFRFFCLFILGGIFINQLFTAVTQPGCGFNEPDPCKWSSCQTYMHRPWLMT